MGASGQPFRARRYHARGGSSGLSRRTRNRRASTRPVADLSDIQRCADSKKDDVMDRTSANTQSWIAFRFQFYMAA